LKRVGYPRAPCFVHLRTSPTGSNASLEYKSRQAEPLVRNEAASCGSAPCVRSQELGSLTSAALTRFSRPQSTSQSTCCRSLRSPWVQDGQVHPGNRNRRQLRQDRRRQRWLLGRPRLRLVCRLVSAPRSCTSTASPSAACRKRRLRPRSFHK